MRLINAPVVAILVAGSVALSGCVTTPKTDVAQAVQEALQPAIDTFFRELDKRLASPEVTLEKIGEVHFGVPVFEPAPPWWFEFLGEAPLEPSQDAPEEAWADWRLAIAAFEAARAMYEAEWIAWHMAGIYWSYFEWGLWATVDDGLLFMAHLDGETYRANGCPPHPLIDCAVPLVHDGVRATVFGNPSGSNPVAGSAVWTGYSRAVLESGAPAEGSARVEADFRRATLDVLLSELGGTSLTWRDLAMVDGRFGRIDEERDFHWSWGRSIEGEFYGDGHEGVAGTFHWDRMMGVFGALRE